MPGNSQRKGAVRRKGKGNTAGSGGRGRKGLAGKGPTPKASERTYHKAYRPSGKSSGNKPSGAGRPPRSTPKSGVGADWVIGRNPVLEALEAGIPVKKAFVAEGSDRDDRLRDIFKLAADRSLTLLQVTRAELDRMTKDAVHQGVALQLPAYDYLHPDDLLTQSLDAPGASLVVALDQIQDPRNLGAIIRSAAAFGANGVLIPERRSAQMSAAAWKTSAGAAARIPVARATNLNRTLRTYADAGFTLIGLAGESDTDLAGVPGASGPVVLVVGSEGQGLSRLVREACDQVVAIPITAEVESLNASVATGIALYELSRQRPS